VRLRLYHPESRFVAGDQDGAQRNENVWVAGRREGGYPNAPARFGAIQASLRVQVDASDETLNLGPSEITRHRCADDLPQT
jgi:hypothetical protein